MTLPEQREIMNFELLQRLALALAVVLSMSACDGAGSSFSRPGPTSPGGPVPTYTVTGVISEATATGVTPLHGAVVRDERSGQETTTDDTGFYRLTGVAGSNNFISARKPGYIDTWQILSIFADTQIHLEMRRVESYVLSGTVYEMTGQGRVPIEGVSVYCDSCGSPLGHTWSETGTDGRYSFGWTRPGEIPLIVRKEGYRLPDHLPLGPMDGRIVATVKGDTRFDIELMRGSR